MARTAVRRVNEWDGPSMLKVYAPYTGTPAAPEEEPPAPAGLCPAHRPLHLRPGLAAVRDRPPDRGLLPSERGPLPPGGPVLGGVPAVCEAGFAAPRRGHRPVEPDAGHDGDGQPPAGALPGGPGKPAALAFFQAMGFVPWQGEPPEEPEKPWLAYTCAPWAPGGGKAHQALLGGGGGLRGGPGAGCGAGGCHRALNTLERGKAGGTSASLFLSGTFEGREKPRGRPRRDIEKILTNL